MAAIQEKDMLRGEMAFEDWRRAAVDELNHALNSTSMLTHSRTESTSFFDDTDSDVDIADDIADTVTERNLDESIDVVADDELAGIVDDDARTPVVDIDFIPARIWQTVPADVRLQIAPKLARPTMAMAVRYSLHLLELKAPGPGVEVRVAPFSAVKILEGPKSDPHNLTPPDVIELDPAVWLRLATGVTSWSEEKEAGHISAVGERDDLSDILPLFTH